MGNGEVTLETIDVRFLCPPKKRATSCAPLPEQVDITVIDENGAATPTLYLYKQRTPHDAPETPLLACLLALAPALAQEPAPAPAPETGSDKDEEENRSG
ncbi:MAG: hypothetical protein R3E96_02355 [Planctomycetota bacterium]